MAWIKTYTEMEGRLRWKGDRSSLIEFTLPVEDGHRTYFVPNKCINDRNETDGTGNFMFEISDWWFERAHEFRADETRDRG